MNLSDITLAFIGGMKGWEIVVILVVVLLLFGGKKIPELMRGVGKGIREFKSGVSGLEDEMKKDDSKPAKQEEKNSSKASS